MGRLKEFISGYPGLGSCFHCCLIRLFQINVGTTVTMTGNGTRPPPAANAEAAPPGPGQASSLAPTSTAVDSSTEGVPPPGPAPPPTTSHPRVIRISHQSVEPVVMMHMNIQGELGPVVGRAELHDAGGGVEARRCEREGGEGRSQGRLPEQRNQGRSFSRPVSLQIGVRGEGSASSLSRWREKPAFWWRGE